MGKREQSNQRFIYRRWGTKKCTQELQRGEGRRNVNGMIILIFGIKNANEQYCHLLELKEKKLREKGC